MISSAIMPPSSTSELELCSNGGDNAIGTPRLWICGLLVAVLNVVDLHTYTLAVKRADIVVVYPIYNAYAITFTMLSGIFVLGEGDDMQTWGKLLVVAAVVCFACGTPLLCRSSVRLADGDSASSLHDNATQADGSALRSEGEGVTGATVSLGPNVTPLTSQGVHRTSTKAFE